ncbi:MAG: hypothetical protein KJ018_08450, partial [Burkholderiales bacterium]|nr:hypothetical protein [Burkholderiales bacterium]
ALLLHARRLIRVHRRLARVAAGLVGADACLAGVATRLHGPRALLVARRLCAGLGLRRRGRGGGLRAADELDVRGARLLGAVSLRRHDGAGRIVALRGEIDDAGDEDDRDRCRDAP